MRVKEFRDIVISALVLALAFGIALSGGFRAFQRTDILVLVIGMSLVAVSLDFVLHELGHRLIARKLRRDSHHVGRSHLHARVRSRMASNECRGGSIRRHRIHHRNVRTHRRAGWHCDAHRGEVRDHLAQTSRWVMASDGRLLQHQRTTDGRRRLKSKDSKEMKRVESYC